MCQIGISNEAGRRFMLNRVVDPHIELRTQEENVQKYLMMNKFGRMMGLG